MITYDLLIIGSGPAGQRAAIYANKLGKRAAVVERMRTIGGVSVNTGTIPSKTMREAVMHLSGYNYRSIYGMNYRVKEKITMADLAFRVQHVICLRCQGNMQRQIVAFFVERCERAEFNSQIAGCL